MASINGHGGHCCGRLSIANFGALRHHGGGNHYDDYDLDRFMKRLSDSLARCTVRGICYEVVLTNGQLNQKPDLGEALANHGFELVHRFRNKNSGAICNVFLWSGPGKRSLTNVGTNRGLRKFMEISRQKNVETN